MLASIWEIFQICSTWLVLFVMVLLVFCMLGHFIDEKYFRYKKCPECGHAQFQIMIGGPLMCMKCNWQETQRWIDENPDVIIKGREYKTHW
ncbi:MAG: hypothetical protein ABFQ53_03855 [Patescibacteria group bacterium]